MKKKRNEIHEEEEIGVLSSLDHEDADGVGEPSPRLPAVDANNGISFLPTAVLHTLLHRPVEPVVNVL
eukprot:m.109676 g.109676  ORF g.109676 m.109676 type:complete len:68 (+) comp12737_c0_seq2:1959-2162(+)